MTPITEEWLSQTGFKWHQLERQPSKHWLLWIGDAVNRDDEKWRYTSGEDLGVEVASGAQGNEWFCWIRSDSAGRYSRFVHIRHLRTQEELIRLIEGLTGREWKPEDVLYGGYRTPKQAERLRQEAERLDLRWMKSNKWRKSIESDDTMGGALPEHLEGYIEHGLKDKRA